MRGLVHGKGLATRCQPRAPRCLLRGCFTASSTPTALPCPPDLLEPGLHSPGTKAKNPFCVEQRLESALFTGVLQESQIGLEIRPEVRPTFQIIRQKKRSGMSQHLNEAELLRTALGALIGCIKMTLVARARLGWPWLSVTWRIEQIKWEN